MGFDARLSTGDEVFFEDNHTHNCNRMMSAALEERGYELGEHWLIGHMGKSWFDAIHGQSGREAASVLRIIVDAMSADPAKYRAMQPANGWGSYESALGLMERMLAVSDAYPVARWSISG